MSNLSQILDGLRRSVAQDRETSCFDKPVVVALLDIAEAAANVTDNVTIAFSGAGYEVNFTGSAASAMDDLAAALASLTGAGE